MKNASSLKSTKSESPKTPGGISKSLLTPCRRIGLSRNWKKAGPSPFISPLSGNNSSSTEVKVETKETRKRKQRVPDHEIEDNNMKSTETLVDNNIEVDNSESPLLVCNNDDIVGTPSRRVELPRKKKSKTLISAIKENIIDIQERENVEQQLHVEEVITSKSDTVVDMLQAEIPQESEAISISKQGLSTNKFKKSTSPIKSVSKVVKVPKCHHVNTKEDVKANKGTLKQDGNGVCDENNVKPISPKELTKECIVVIQKKIFKVDKKESKKIVDDTNKVQISTVTKNSQIVFDSDSDEVPLCNLNKHEEHAQKTDSNVIVIDEDDDFTDNNKVIVKKLVDKNTSTGGLKTTKKKTVKNKSPKNKKIAVIQEKPNPSSQSSNSFDDDDDFDLENKRTILIRKTYDKVTKPLKAKSTGSITQRDIDELKARIEMKKKLLLTKAVTKDTEELRSLIKKWQRGCQDALVELMDLMKNKCPEKQNMDYSEMLQTLKIPASLVGYDSDNDCFNTPDDTSIILSKFNINL